MHVLECAFSWPRRKPHPLKSAAPPRMSGTRLRLTVTALILLIVAACRSGSREAETRAAELLLTERLAIKGNAAQGFLITKFSGQLYNGNSNVTVSEVQINVTTKKGSHESSREYRVPVIIPPLSAKSFSFDFIPGEYGSSYGWSITAAKGYRSGE